MNFIKISQNRLDKNLHIVCHDVPFPVDYGGVFDLFYKIKALSEQGIGIHLHCFEYGRQRQSELNRYCKTVRYYKRSPVLSAVSFRLPYIVSSRMNSRLMKNLLLDDHPILLEGIHCSFPLIDKRFQGRKMVLRLHNVEYSYYHELIKSTNSLFKKLYYSIESKLLYKYEKRIARKALILPVSEQDLTIYQQVFNPDKIVHLPVFLPYTQILTQEGVGYYCLYHGNLSVAENEKAAIWLLKNVFTELTTPFVIAGKQPSKNLKAAVSHRPHTCLVENPSGEEMQDLVAKAQINIVPSFNKTGIKLKLLNALFNGRHCVVNEAAVTGSSLGAACHVASDGQGMKKIISRIYHQPLKPEDIQRRRFLLEEKYNNANNARQLIRLIW